MYVVRATSAATFQKQILKRERIVRLDDFSMRQPQPLPLPRPRYPYPARGPRWQRHSTRDSVFPPQSRIPVRNHDKRPPHRKSEGLPAALLPELSATVRSEKWQRYTECSGSTGMEALEVKGCGQPTAPREQDLGHFIDRAVFGITVAQYILHYDGHFGALCLSIFERLAQTHI